MKPISVVDALFDYTYCIVLSAWGASVMPEAIHGIAVIITAGLSTIVMHYIKKFLNKNKK